MVTTKKNIAINVVRKYQQLIIPPGVAVAIGGTRKRKGVREEERVERDAPLISKMNR